jgi:hypothetical protein
MDEIPASTSPPERVTPKMVDDYIKISGLSEKVTPEERARLVAYSLKFNLNPLLREVNLVPTTERGGLRYTPVMGHEVYLRTAEHTGLLDGWKTWVEGEGDNLKAVIQIFRTDWSHVFQHEVYLSEAIQRQDDGSPTPFWRKMTRFNLKKVAICQGFRLAFPEALSGAPYEMAELPVSGPIESPSSLATPPPSPTPLPGPPTSAPVGSAFDELGNYLREHSTFFTAKHLTWITQTLQKESTPAKARSLLVYSKRVVESGGDPPEQPKSPRTYSNRTQRKPEALPNF